ncbi:Mannosyltransferase (PIG-V) [Singulisphaera sp. GP187]|uniref:mannosyltransferase family protein n=1 Tax=Singulisphaera sp. GP187 TaxID=1882752 RepID=UPI00092AC318|nr:mannosyltransferase family protein [Singulisphaera sp. GP187]SIO56366.1 Mannosyltransferase (PIG-V) [Singulisphaera sp. GP187]
MSTLPKALGYYYLTGMVVAGGFLLGSEVLKSSPVRGNTFAYSGEPFTNWDAQWYQKIAAQGYDYSRTSFSSAVFFPAYPMLGRLVSRATGLNVDYSLLLISNVCLIASLSLILRYFQVRYPEHDARLGGYAVIALTTLPASLFFRVNYSESLFLLILATFLLAMAKQCHPALIAGLVGFATAVRPVGVALIPALIVHAWRSGGRPAARVARLAYLLPLSIWGIAAFSAYLYLRFGDPLAFARGQEAWSLRPDESPGHRLFCLLTFEPLRSIFTPSSGAYWYNHEYHHSLVFNMRVVDMLYFVGFSGLVAVGAWRRWLNGPEILTSALLILIPYVTNGYGRTMISTARYSSVIIPAYAVIAHLLYKVEPPIVSALVGISCFFLGAFSALFATWHVII